MNPKYFLLIVAASAAIFTGCGSNHTGTYSGSETITTPGLAPVSNQVSLNISSDKDSAETGSFSDSTGSSNFTATLSSDGTQLQSVSLSVPAQSGATSVNGIPAAGCGGTYTGTLSISNNTISGTLTLTSPQPSTTPTTTVPPQYGTATGGGIGGTLTSPCQGATRAVNLTKSS